MTKTIATYVIPFEDGVETYKLYLSDEEPYSDKVGNTKGFFISQAISNHPELDCTIKLSECFAHEAVEALRGLMFDIRGIKSPEVAASLDTLQESFFGMYERAMANA